MNDRDNASQIIQLAHDALIAGQSEDAQLALSVLAKIDLAAASALAIILTQAVPQSEALWRAVLNWAINDIARYGGEQSWGAEDSAETADGAARFLQGGGEARA